MSEQRAHAGSTGYLPALDGLRAVAVMSVLLAHVGYYIAPGGYIGVDVFFVLSGFLITRILLVEYERTDRISIGRFYLRRALRLYPALVVAVLLALITIRYSYGGSFARWGHEAALSLTYLMDVGRSVGNPAIDDAGPLGINWTLAVEEHFYLIWPIMLMVLLRRGGTALAVRVALACAFLSWTGLLVSTVAGVDPNLLYFRPDLRCGGMFLGCVLALTVDRLSPALVARMQVPAAVVLIVLIQAAQTNAGLGAWAVRLPLTWLSTLVVVAGVAVGGGGLVERALSLSPLRYVGRISYGIYAYHLIIIVAIVNLGLPLSVRLVCSVIVPIAFAAVSFALVEKRFLALKDRYGHSKSEERSKVQTI